MSQNLIARSAFALFGIVLMVSVLVTSLVLADNWTTDETARAMRVLTSIFLFAPMCLTLYVACTKDDWKVRLAAGVAGLIVTAFGAGMFSSGATESVSTVLVITALVGSAVGSIAGEALRERDFWTELTNTISGAFHARTSLRRTYR